MVVLRAIATASTDAHTEVAPFTPHSQGVSAGRLRASPRPSGNAIPMNRPGTARSAAETAIRTGVAAPSMRCVSIGVMTPNTISRPRRPVRRTIPAGQRAADAAREQQREQHYGQAVGGVAQHDDEALHLRRLDQHEAEADGG